MGKVERHYINMIEAANLNLRKKILLIDYFGNKGLSSREIVDKLILLDKNYPTFETGF